MTQPYVWAPVFPAQVADDNAINALGAAVTGHDTRLTTLTGLAPVYSARSTVVGAAVPGVTISSIPTTLKRLKVYWSARGDAAGQGELISCQIGGDTGGNYSYTNAQVQNATVIGGSGHGATSGVIGLCTAAAATATWFGHGEVIFFPWDNINAGSLGYSFSSGSMGTTTANQFFAPGSGVYTGIAARTSVTFLPQSGNFIAGTDFQLEGW